MIGARRRRRSRLAGGLMLSLWAAGSGVSATVCAQDSVPSGPAELIKRANQGRAQAEMERAAEVGDTAAQAREERGGSAEAQGQTEAQAAQDEASRPAPRAVGDPHSVLAEPTMAGAVPAADLPAGSIAVEVRDPQGARYGGIEVGLGIMASMGSRSQKTAKTNEQGVALFQGLAVGTQQAYRVNVMFGGAKFSSTPFRLPEDKGYRVQVPLRATTHDSTMIFQLIGQTVVELRDDRLHVTQQARLSNAGQQVYVFPEQGLLIPLPEGFTAFQWQDQMTDQHAEAVEGEGMRLTGSLPPGSVTLGWAFDLPREGDEARISLNVPFRTYTYRVISEAPEGLKLRVHGFPEPERIQDKGRSLLFTQMKRAPTDPLLGSFSIRLEGIPAPGPGRWIALALALASVVVGLAVGLRRGDDAEDRRVALAARKRALMDEVRALEAERAQGEIGPEYHAARLDELTTELALLLRDEQALQQGPAGRSSAASAGPKRRAS